MNKMKIELYSDDKDFMFENVKRFPAFSEVFRIFIYVSSEQMLEIAFRELIKLVADGYNHTR